MHDGAQISNPTQYQIPAFESFERFVLEWLDGRALSREDYVFRPQADFILRQGETIGVSHVGRLEDSATYLDFAEAALGRRLDVRHLNRTSSGQDYRAAFTKEMRDMVARAYAQDIETFGYDF